MDGIAEIGLPAPGLFHILGMGQYGLKACLLQDIEDRDPVLAGRFHADIGNAEGRKPASHAADVAVGRRELPHVKNSFKRFRVSKADSGHEDRFVDINGCTGRAFDIRNS